MEDTTVTCYRHPGREAPLRCTRCERPICLEDAVDAPVGFLCPEDARQSPRVRRAMKAAGAPVTRTLVYVLVGVYLIQLFGGEGFTRRFFLWGPAVSELGQWYRLLTSAFLHATGSLVALLHIAFNGYLLWALGHMMEPSMGRGRFLGVYAAGLMGGSAGVVLLSWGARTLGASGAVFGLMGAAMVLLRRRGIDPWQTSIGSLVLLNLVITFVVPGIAVGAHLGGLAGGALAAATIAGESPDAGASVTVRPWAVAVALTVVAWYAAAAGPLLPPIPFLS